MNDIEKIIDGDFTNFFLIAGPCVVESYETCYQVAQALKNICSELQLPFIFKSSFRKANRTKLESFQGIGDQSAIDILSCIRSELEIAVTTDIHETSDVELVKNHIDLIQIPAFLCRQTALLQSAGRSGLPVNIKKGQFMSARAMQYAIEKVTQGNDTKVMVTERGNTFGYGDLVVDPRNIAILSELATTIIDCSHASQRPNQSGGVTGGNPEEIELFARVGLVSGAKGLFIEVHPDPAKAQSDGSSMLPLDDMKQLLYRLEAFSSSL